VLDISGGQDTGALHRLGIDGAVGRPLSPQSLTLSAPMPA
jgi:hypothetical protein